MNAVIEISHLSKAFKDIQAVGDLSFQVREGELFAFLGINGAGKSTTISILSGLLAKDRGKVIVDGFDLDEDSVSYKSRIGVVYQHSLLDKKLTVKENLEVRAALYGMTKKEFVRHLNDLAARLDFANLLSRPLGKLSGGQRRKIDIARALIHQPKILILDEPTTGLDPKTRKQVWKVIADLRKEKNLSVLLTTHYMEEAGDADYVVIIDEGKICAEGTPLELKNRYACDFISLYGADEGELGLLGKPYEKIAGGYRIEVRDTAQATEMILAHPELFRDYEIVKGKMDDVFLSATGKRLNEENAR